MAAEYVTVAEAAQAVRRSEKTVYRAIAAGHLRAYRLGRRYLIRREDVVDWVECQVVQVRATRPQATTPLSPVEVGSLAMLREIERAA